MTLLARLFGDLASISLPPDERIEQGIEAHTQLQRILNENFGKAIKVIPHPESEESPSSCSGTISDERRVHSLHLSLEEAFYLMHVEQCLALALRVSEDDATENFSEGLKGLDSHQCHHHQECSRTDTDDERGANCESALLTVEQKGCAPPSVPYRGYARGHSTGEDDAVYLLSDKQAWRYCCSRRPGFPSTFVVYRYFRTKGYTVHTGQKYGTHFVLYEGSPDEVHSRYCVHVRHAGGGDSWGHLKTMTRLMPDVSKNLLVCGVSYDSQCVISSPPCSPSLLDTPTLESMQRARVTVLSFSRSSVTEKVLLGRDESPDEDGRPRGVLVPSGKGDSSKGKATRASAKNRSMKKKK